MNRFGLALGLTFLLCQWRATAHPLAFIQNPNTEQEQIRFIYWQQIKDGAPIPFLINRAGSDAITIGPEDGELDEFEAMTLAFRQWETLSDLPIQFELGHTDVRQAGNDGLNVIYFADQGNVGYGGVALITFDNQTGAILDADIHMNDFNIRWMTSPNGANGEPLPCPCPGENADRPYRNDVQGLAAHEIGHILGLDHSAVGARAQGATPTMYALGIWGVPNTGNIPPNSLYRTLEADDHAGLREIYHDDHTAMGYHGFGGVVHDSMDQPLLGASIIATNRDNGLQYGTLSGITQGDYQPGVYRFESLPAGDYHVKVVPLDGTTLSGMTRFNLGGIANSVTGRFPAAFSLKERYHFEAETAGASEPVTLPSQNSVDFRPLFVVNRLPAFRPSPTPFTVTGRVNEELLHTVDNASLVVSIDGQETAYPVSGSFSREFPAPPAGNLVRYHLRAEGHREGGPTRSFTHEPHASQLGLSGDPMIFVSKMGSFEVAAVDSGTLHELDTVSQDMSYPLGISYSRRERGIYVANFGADSIQFVPLLDGQLPPTTPRSGDRDGDGLPDTLEPVFVTDPDRADSDGDLALDGAEIPVVITNLGTGDERFTVWGGLVSQDGFAIGQPTVVTAIWNDSQNGWASSVQVMPTSGRFQWQLDSGDQYSILVYDDQGVIASSVSFSAAPNETLIIPNIEVPINLAGTHVDYGGTDPTDPWSGGGAFFAPPSKRIILEPGADVAAIAMDPCEERFLYLSYGLRGQVAKLDTELETVVDVVQLDGIIQGLTLTADGSKLYVMGTDAFAIYVLDPDTLAVRDQIPLTGKPQHARINASGKYMVVSTEGDHDVAILDTTTDRLHAVLASGLPSQKWVTTAARNADSALVGRFQIGETNVVAVQPESATLKTLDLGAISATSGVALSPDGSRAYVVHYMDPELLEVDISDGEILRRMPFGFIDIRDIELIDLELPPNALHYVAPSPDQVVCVSGELNLSVETPHCDVGFQWTHNDVPIAGATDRVWSKSNFAGSDVGTYRCLLTRGEEQLVSAPIDVSLGTPPIIDENPVDAVRGLGENVVFSVGSHDTIGYQWYRNNQALAGQTGAQLSLSSLDAAASGTYFCRVAGTCASRNSTSATLSLRGILSAQLPRVRALGVGPYTLRPTVIGNHHALRYQWRSQGNLLVGESDSLHWEPAASGRVVLHINDTVTGESISAASLLLVARQERFRDFNNDGFNTLADLQGALSFWRTDHTETDADGDRRFTVLDLLHIDVTTAE